MSENDEMNIRLPNRSRAYLKRKCKSSENAMLSIIQKPSKTSKLSTPNKVEDVDPPTLLPNLPNKIFTATKPHETDNEEKRVGLLLTDLPNEVVSEILGKVSYGDLFHLERVNKRIRGIILDLVWPKKSSLSREAITQFAKPQTIAKSRSKRVCKLPYKFVKALCSRTNIHHVDLSFTNVKWQINKLFSMVPQVKTLNLSSSLMLFKGNLFEIAKHCPLLEELFFHESLTSLQCEEGLKHIFIKCLNLKYLTLCENDYTFNGSSFAHIPTQLKYLNIFKCWNLSSQAMNYLAIRSQNLETLILGDYGNAINLENWLKKLKKLRFLELSVRKWIYLDLSNFKELEMFSLNYFRPNNLEILQTLQRCHKLKALDIDFCWDTNINIMEFLNNCSALKYCHFRGCRNVKGLIELVQNCKLNYLSISKSDDLGDEVINSLLTECDSLTHLEFTRIPDFNYKSISRAFKKENSHRRKVLKLVIEKHPSFELPPCKWCENIQVEKDGEQVFSYFTDVRAQYRN